MPTIQLYNTQTRKKDLFTPIDPERITMYVCGPTVYNYIHIGNARPIVVFDMLFRLLRHDYPQVVYARNITDIDDKINAAAHKQKQPISTISQQFIHAFHQDIAQLNTLAPSIEPYATEHIKSMQTMIQQLIDNGHAYQAKGHVLFHVPSMPDYGKLSGRNHEDMIAGARVEIAPYKRDSTDFVLWKPSTEDLPGWDSPWGFGRPGWHLECSAMIAQHLGTNIDIHGGGQDLIFPHHENELAQTRCAHSGTVNYWLHNGYITLDGEKMAKSKGNFFTVHDILQHYQGEVVRFALLNAHYRSPLDWSETTLPQAKSSLDRLYKALLGMDTYHHIDNNIDIPETILQHLRNDLASADAIAHLHQIAHDINKSTDANEKKRLQQQLLKGGEILGILQQSPQEWFHWQAPQATNFNETQIQKLIEERNEARKNKDFSRADAIRAELLDANIELEDSPHGTRWQYIHQ